jgi:dienelactone hydrolase
VYRPAALEAFPKKDSLPVMVWGNGGCAMENKRYAEFLSTIASHGFLVLSTLAPTAAPAPAGGTAPRRQQATADHLRAAIDWAAQENERTGSPLKGKIALDKIAVMGQSCGGFLSIALGADPRVKTIGVFNSGVQQPAPGAPASPQPTPDALAKLHGPVLLINGHEPDFMMAASAATFDKIDKLPAFYGARHNAGHTATVFHPGGGEYANVASNWLKWTFKRDKKAGTMFTGKECGLCTNSNWDVRSKGI